MNTEDKKDGGPDPDELARRAQRGEAEAFDDIVETFGGPMLNLAYRMTGNRADAEDLTQEIFVKLHRCLGQFKGQSRFSTWLFSLAANTCRDGMRRIRRRTSVETGRLDADREDGFAALEPVANDPYPAVVMERAELRERVEAAVAALPVEFREAMILRDLHDLSYEEIAQTLKCGIGTVKSRIARARHRVMDMLGDRQAL